MGVHHRKSTPAGFLLIGYFSFLLFPCFCPNFFFCFTFALDWLSFLTFWSIDPNLFWLECLTLHCSLSLTPSCSVSHALLIHCFFFPHRAWTEPPASAIYLHLTPSAPSHFISLFYHLVQPFYSIILGPHEWDSDPCTYHSYYWLLVMFKFILMGVPG